MNPFCPKLAQFDPKLNGFCTKLTQWYPKMD